MTDPIELDVFLQSLMPRLGEMARRGFENPGPVDYKFPGQPVTETDRAIEAVAREAIEGTYPDHVIVGEEQGGDSSPTDLVWWIDPIDGTNNFTRGIPMFCVSIGATRGGKPVVGQVLDPLRGELFRGVTGEGAWLGEQRLSTTTVTLADADISTQTTASGERAGKPAFYRELIRSAGKTRKLGTMALELAYVAAGRLDLMVIAKRRPQAWWDLAGGWAVLEEAGGILVDFEGRPPTESSNKLVAGRGSLVREFVTAFEEFDAT